VYATDTKASRLTSTLQKDHGADFFSRKWHAAIDIINLEEERERRCVAARLREDEIAAVVNGSAAARRFIEQTASIPADPADVPDAVAMVAIITDARNAEAIDRLPAMAFAILEAMGIKDLFPGAPMRSLNGAATAEPTRVRLQLSELGYDPIPLRGKRPPLDEWGLLTVLVLDTLNKFHTLPENSSEMTELMRALSELAEECNIAIDVLHHTRKPAAGAATNVTADDARGSSAIIGDVRSSRVLNQMTKDEAEKARVDESDRWRYLRLDGAGANMAPPLAAQWLRHHSEILPCGESVEVTEPWEYPNPFDDVSAKDLETARALAAGGMPGSGDKYRADTRSDDWFGYALAASLPHLHLTPQEVGKDGKPTPKAKADKSKLTAMINTWIANKALKKVTGQDPDTRKRKDYIYPGDFGERDDKVVDISQRLPQQRDDIDPEDQI
jgi:hypothetical protein